MSYFQPSAILFDVENLKKSIIILSGALLSFVLASQITVLDFLPDQEFTQIPAVLLPIFISILVICWPYLAKHHYLFIFIVAIPLLALFAGFYLFGFLLRNLH